MVAADEHYFARLVSLTFLFHSQRIQQEVQHPKAKSQKTKKKRGVKAGISRAIVQSASYLFKYPHGGSARIRKPRPSLIRQELSAGKVVLKVESLNFSLCVGGGGKGRARCGVQRKSLKWRSSHDDQTVMGLHTAKKRGSLSRDVNTFQLTLPPTPRGDGRD